MAPVRDQLLAHRDLIHSLAVQQKRPLSQVASALEQRGVKASVPTLSRFVREMFSPSEGADMISPPLSPVPQPAPIPAPGVASAASELVTVIEKHSQAIAGLETYLREESVPVADPIDRR